MSLTQFVDRPAIKDAFKKFAIRGRTPVSLRNRSLLIADASGRPQLAGTTFDYLACAHILIAKIPIGFAHARLCVHGR